MKERGWLVELGSHAALVLATAFARSRYGNVWLFDPTGQVHATDLPAGVRRLRSIASLTSTPRARMAATSALKSSLCKMM